MPDKTVWSDLPNAAHIDRILDHVKENPKAWGDATRDAAWYAARDAAWNAVSDAAWNAVSDAAWSATRAAARSAARDAILALIAWDDCGHLLDADPDQVRMWAALGQPAAVLLLPACVVLHATDLAVKPAPQGGAIRPMLFLPELG
jgi:hypothetical protein